MAHLGLGQETPVERLVLSISLVQRDRRSGFHQLMTQIKRMRRVFDAHLIEDYEWVGTNQKVGIVERVNSAILGKNPPVPILDPRRNLGETFGTKPRRLIISENDQSRFHSLGQGLLRDRVMDQAASQIEFDDRRPGPVDDRRGQDARDAQLLTIPGNNCVLDGIF